MMPMQDGILIAHARKDWNLFILDLTTPGKVMQVNVKVMMTTGRGRPTHLVSRIKKVRIWHKRFGHVSNARIIRASKLLTRMGNFNEEYDPAEIYSDSKASEPKEIFTDIDADNSNPVETPATGPAETPITMKAFKIFNSDIDQIYEPYVGSKQTPVVRRYKPMTPIEKILHEVHVNLWGSHDPLSLSGSTYAAILVCEKSK